MQPLPLSFSLSLFLFHSELSLAASLSLSLSLPLYLSPILSLTPLHGNLQQQNTKKQKGAALHHVFPLTITCKSYIAVARWPDRHLCMAATLPLVPSQSLPVIPLYYIYVTKTKEERGGKQLKNTRKESHTSPKSASSTCIISRAPLCRRPLLQTLSFVLYHPIS